MDRSYCFHATSDKYIILQQLGLYIQMKIREIILNEDIDDDIASEDPDLDTVPHLIMQFKKSIDNKGASPIKFEDGSNIVLSPGQMHAFLLKFAALKPAVREQLQAQAIQSKDAFVNVYKGVTSGQ